jgi:NAD(P)-dependent dehydrogenase (short-subunit alcohol dehydrogenase family)
MDLQLWGKQALITGSTAGIGFAVAAGLAREGASIIVNGRSAERVGAAVERLRSTAGTGTVDLLGVAADLSTADGAARLVAQVPDVDILVNNLGIFEPKPFEEISDTDWLRFFKTNVMS